MQHPISRATLSRRALTATALATPALLATRPTRAQAWQPTRDVEFVIPFAVGGGADLLARVVHRVITEERLTPVSVNPVNRPGGGGAVGLGYVAASRMTDPNTIVMVNGTTQITPILNPQARTLAHIRPVMNVMLDDFLFFVRGDAPYRTAAEFAADAKTKPAKTLSFSTGGTTDQMAIAIFSRAAGSEFNPVNFNSGGEALTALLGGHVNASIGNPLEFMGHLRSGAIRAIGVFRETRFQELPDVPTMKEQGLATPAFQMWRGVAVPRGVPDAARAYWLGVMEKVMVSPILKSFIAENVATLAPIPGPAFETFLANQETLYRELLGKPA